MTKGNRLRSVPPSGHSAVVLLAFVLAPETVALRDCAIMQPPATTAAVELASPARVAVADSAPPQRALAVSYKLRRR